MLPDAKGRSTEAIGTADSPETLLEEPRPVDDRPSAETCKDKVKVIGKVPVILEVINEKGHVGRDTASF